MQDNKKKFPLKQVECPHFLTSIRMVGDRKMIETPNNKKSTDFGGSDFGNVDDIFEFIARGVPTKKNPHRFSCRSCSACVV